VRALVRATQMTLEFDYFFIAWLRT